MCAEYRRRYVVHSLLEILCQSRVEALRIDFALQDVDVSKSHELELACRGVARDVDVVNEKGPASLVLRRDRLRSALRRERSLEARGVEPLSSSLSAQTSTRLSGDKF
jgi:hypothetical protein